MEVFFVEGFNKAKICGKTRSHSFLLRSRRMGHFKLMSR
jgi:hypothetical protein